MIFGLSRAMAQSTIFNIPTTDTVSKGKQYFEFGVMPQLPASKDTRSYLYNPRFVLGLPHDIEAGVNVPIWNVRGSGFSDTNAYIQPNIKWKFYRNDDSGLAAAAGFLWNAPINHRNGQEGWGMAYGLLSKKFKAGNYGPRFHVGGYGVVHANQDPTIGPVSFKGPRAGAIIGYEQPVHSNISFVADWFSGKNGLGYFTPGVSITLPKNGLLNVGYCFGNDSWASSNATKNRYLFVYYGITF
jgi:hypothetical protein